VGKFKIQMEKNILAVIVFAALVAVMPVNEVRAQYTNG
jgi:hypothetical protein